MEAFNEPAAHIDAEIHVPTEILPTKEVEVGNLRLNQLYVFNNFLYLAYCLRIFIVMRYYIRKINSDELNYKNWDNSLKKKSKIELS